MCVCVYLCVCVGVCTSGVYVHIHQYKLLELFSFLYFFLFGCAGSSWPHGLSLVVASGGYTPVVVHRLLTVVVSRVGLSTCGTQT